MNVFKSVLIVWDLFLSHFSIVNYMIFNEIVYDFRIINIVNWKKKQHKSITIKVRCCSNSKNEIKHFVCSYFIRSWIVDAHQIDRVISLSWSFFLNFCKCFQCSWNMIKVERKKELANRNRMCSALMNMVNISWNVLVTFSHIIMRFDVHTVYANQIDGYNSWG